MVRDHRGVTTELYSIAGYFASHPAVGIGHRPATHRTGRRVNAANVVKSGFPTNFVKKFTRSSSRQTLVVAERLDDSKRKHTRGKRLGSRTDKTGLTNPDFGKPAAGN